MLLKYYYNATTCFSLMRPSSGDTYMRELLHCALIRCNSLLLLSFHFLCFYSSYFFLFCCAAILCFAGVLVIVCFKCAFVFTVCVPWCCLAVAGHSHSTILAFSSHVTVLVLILTLKEEALISTLQNSGSTRMQIIAVTFNVHRLILQLFEETELYCILIFTFW
jgi:hypothetical protein